MINGTVKCEIVDRVMMAAQGGTLGYCAQMRVRVKGWADGAAIESYFVVFFPELMRNRMAYFMKAETKYCVIIFDTMSIIERADEGFPLIICLRANRIEA